MELKQYDAQWLRITDTLYDGYCRYHNAGDDKTHEESLRMIHHRFYKNDILKIESLENHHGIYGRFDDPYGYFEDMTVNKGFDSILEVLFCDKNDHVMRLLNCLDKYMDPGYGYAFPCKYKTIGALMELIDTTDDDNIRNEAKLLIEIGID